MKMRTMSVSRCLFDRSGDGPAYGMHSDANTAGASGQPAKPPERLPWWIYGGIIVLGTLLPLLVFLCAMAVDSAVNPDRAAAARVLFFRLLHPVALSFQCAYALPFAALALFARQRLSTAPGRRALAVRSAGLIGSGIGPVALYVSVTLMLYEEIGVEKNEAVFSGLAPYVFLLMAFVASFWWLPLGYFCGWCVGKALLWRCHRNAPRRCPSG
ncbi:MAG: hypothetical protein OEU26_18925 [Candidatus Tectomicrobia bacterium]|nr:hypothetical protein [Candidatus Tectomicrobia bacterium]